SSSSYFTQLRNQGSIFIIACISYALNIAREGEYRSVQWQKIFEVVFSNPPFSGFDFLENPAILEEKQEEKEQEQAEMKKKNPIAFNRCDLIPTLFAFAKEHQPEQDRDDIALTVMTAQKSFSPDFLKRLDQAYQLGLTWSVSLT